VIPNSDSILFGLTEQGEAVRLAYPDLLHHVAVWGPTGSGKSSFLRETLEQIRNRVSILCLDAADDYVDMAGAIVIDPVRDGIPYDPRDLPVDPYSGVPIGTQEHARLLTEQIRGLRPGIGPRQYEVLNRCVGDMLRRHLGLPDLPDLLRAATWANSGIQSSLIGQLEPILADPGLRSSPRLRARDLVDGSPGLRVVRMRANAADSELARVVFCLKGVLQASFERRPETGAPMILLLDELHRFRHPLVASLIDRIVREGRKFGLYLWTSDQEVPSDTVRTNCGLAVQMLQSSEPGEALVSLTGSAPVRMFCTQRRAVRRGRPSGPEAMALPKLGGGSRPVSRFLEEIN
jgi:hypothetical protein